jgi:hypothetical protein
MDATSTTCTINGLKLGLFFASNILTTAVSLSAFAANPYTVSVGMATNSSDSRRVAAFNKFSPI